MSLTSTSSTPKSNVDLEERESGVQVSPPFSTRRKPSPLRGVLEDHHFPQALDIPEERSSHVDLDSSAGGITPELLLHVCWAEFSFVLQ